MCWKMSKYSLGMKKIRTLNQIIRLSKKKKKRRQFKLMPGSYGLISFVLCDMFLFDHIMHRVFIETLVADCERQIL